MSNAVIDLDDDSDIEILTPPEAVKTAPDKAEPDDVLTPPEPAVKPTPAVVQPVGAPPGVVKRFGRQPPPDDDFSSANYSKTGSFSRQGRWPVVNEMEEDSGDDSPPSPFNPFTPPRRPTQQLYVPGRGGNRRRRNMRGRGPRGQYHQDYQVPNRDSHGVFQEERQREEENDIEIHIDTRQESPPPTPRLNRDQNSYGIHQQGEQSDRNIEIHIDSPRRSPSYSPPRHLNHQDHDYYGIQREEQGERDIEVHIDRHTYEFFQESKAVRRPDYKSAAERAEGTQRESSPPPPTSRHLNQNMKNQNFYGIHKGEEKRRERSVERYRDSRRESPPRHRNPSHQNSYGIHRGPRRDSPPPTPRNLRNPHQNSYGIHREEEERREDFHREPPRGTSYRSHPYGNASSFYQHRKVSVMETPPPLMGHRNDGSYHETPHFGQLYQESSAPLPRLPMIAMTPMRQGMQDLSLNTPSWRHSSEHRRGSFDQNRFQQPSNFYSNQLESIPEYRNPPPSSDYRNRDEMWRIDNNDAYYEVMRRPIHDRFGNLALDSPCRPNYGGYGAIQSQSFYDFNPQIADYARKREKLLAAEAAMMDHIKRLESAVDDVTEASARLQRPENRYGIVSDSEPSRRQQSTSSAFNFPPFSEFSMGDRPFLQREIEDVRPAQRHQESRRYEPYPKRPSESRHRSPERQRDRKMCRSPSPRRREEKTSGGMFRSPSPKRREEKTSAQIRPRRYNTPEQEALLHENYIPRDHYASTSASWNEKQKQEDRRLKAEMKEEERKKQVHPLSKDCFYSFRRNEEAIRAQIQCEMTLETDILYSGCYYHINLKSEDPNQIEDARKIIDTTIFNDLFNEFDPETKRITFANYVTPQMKTVFSHKWHEIRNIGARYGVLVEFGLRKGGGGDYYAPMILKGTLHGIESFRGKISKYLDEAVIRIITREYDFPKECMGAFVGVGGHKIRNLENSTKTRISVLKEEGRIRITGEDEDGIQEVMKKVKELDEELTAACSRHPVVYFVPVAREKMAGKKGNLNRIQRETGATLTLDSNGTRVICGGNYRQAQQAHHAINQWMGMTPGSQDYEPIFAENHSRLKTQDDQQ